MIESTQNKRGRADLWPILFGSLGLAVLASRCASFKPYPPAPPPPSAEVRKKLGTIAVRSGIPDAKAELHKAKGKGKGAVFGAGAGLGLTLEVMGMGGPAAAVVAAGLSPLFIVGGTIAGAVEGVPKKQRVQAEKTLTNVLAKFTAQERLGTAVLSKARKLTNYAIFIPEPSDALSAASAGLFTNQAVQTFLELRIWKLALAREAGKPAINPPLALIIAVQPRLIRASDQHELYSYATAYCNGAVILATDPVKLSRLCNRYLAESLDRDKKRQSRQSRGFPSEDAVRVIHPPGEREFTAWADEDGRFLRKELEAGLEALAPSILQQLLVTPP